MKWCCYVVSTVYGVRFEDKKLYLGPQPCVCSGRMILPTASSRLSRTKTSIIGDYTSILQQMFSEHSGSKMTTATFNLWAAIESVRPRKGAHASRALGRIAPQQVFITSLKPTMMSTCIPGAPAMSASDQLQAVSLLVLDLPDHLTISKDFVSLQKYLVARPVSRVLPQHYHRPLSSQCLPRHYSCAGQSSAHPHLP